MKTINKYLKVTSKEYKELKALFNSGATLHRKIKLYGSGHPQLPLLFGVKGTEAQRIEFWNDHETTHAKFKEYNSIVDIQNDEHFTRGTLTYPGVEFETCFCLPIYEL